jgi:hypothetical protein
MAISLSLVVVLGIAVWVMYRYGGLKLWHAVVCILFGFYLAATAAAPQIRNLVGSVVAAISGQH